jgi:hypothetical protein
MRLVGLGWIPILLLAVDAALAQPCPIDLRPADGNFGYRHRATPDRCEGLYSAPVAGEALEVLSFVTGRPGFDGQADRNLIISAPDVHVLSAHRVVVVARALPFRVYYRMDATIPSAGSMQWPVGEVVLPAGLDPRNIGLVGRVHAGDATIYVPLRLSVSNAETLQAAPRPIITFRAPIDLQSFQWRLYEVGGVASPWNKYGLAIYAGDPIVLTLDAPAGRVMTLDVAARPEGSDFIQNRLKIFIP